MKTLALLLFCATASAQTYDYQSVLSSGTLTAEVTVTDGILTAYSASYAANGLILALDTGYDGGNHLDLFTPSQSYSSQSGNKITFDPNPIFAFDEAIQHYGNLTLNLGGGTDSVIFTNSSWNPVCGGEFGSAVQCLIQDSGSSGTWVQQAQAIAAPEIDPAGGIGAFLLLAGGLAVVRGRR